MQTWAKTAIQCLVRHCASGVYYARARVGGKLVWKTLETDVFTVAKARLAEAQVSVHAGRSRRRDWPGQILDLPANLYGQLADKRWMHPASNFLNDWFPNVVEALTPKCPFSKSSREEKSVSDSILTR